MVLITRIISPMLLKNKTQKSKTLEKIWYGINLERGYFVKKSSDAVLFFWR